MSKNKLVDLNVVIFGHVNSGRSTSIGHLIYKCTTIDKKMLDELEKESIKVNHIFSMITMNDFCSYRSIKTDQSIIGYWRN